MDLVLSRYSYSPTETEGLLYAPPLSPIWTMEQPWFANAENPAGVPFKSCVPEGVYKLEPFLRSNGHKVWALVNESLDVHVKQQSGYGRYACLIHSGNLVTDSSGCILPGTQRGVLKGKRAVLRSGFRPGYAMQLLTDVLGEMSEGHTLTITHYRGGKYGR